LQIIILIVIVDSITDVARFPFVHTFWNLVGFEGWYAHE
jgi:hypothetical protein